MTQFINLFKQCRVKEPTAKDRSSWYFKSDAQLTRWERVKSMDQLKDNL